MKKLFVILFCIVSLTCTAQQSLITVNGWNAYVHVPYDYNTNTNPYPTIIFFPGVGEVGTNASLVITNGPGAYITQGWNGNVKIGTDSVKFIVISLQPPAAYPSEALMNTRIQTLKSLYRINSRKLYLTGLSEGGWCATTFVTGDPLGGPYTYASQIAAIVNVEGVKPDDNSPYPQLFANYANSGGRLANFEQAQDGRDMPTYTNYMNSIKANSAIYTQTNFGDGSHCCWASFYGGSSTTPTNFTLDGISQNIYQWLARQSLGNKAPTANAGPDITLALPISSTTLNGSGTDQDGVITTYHWAKISGPSTYIIVNPDSAITNINSLVAGTYKFELTVTDDSSATNKDTVQVVVNSSASPVCNAGPFVKYILTPSSSGEIYITDASTRVWKGGDTLVINTPTLNGNELDNLHGDACNPITVINASGVQVTILNYARFKSNDSYVHFTGTGDPNIQYGFVIRGTALAIDYGNHLEFDHIKIVNTNGVGISCKTNPDTTKPITVYLDSTSYVINKIYFHHIWVDSAGGEGMYIGHTAPAGGDGQTVRYNDTTRGYVLPLRGDSLEVAYCIVTNSKWDGIQASNFRHCKIHNNQVYNFGTINMGSQQAGIILGGNCTGDVDSNSITLGTGNGLEIFGYGLIRAFNNTIDSTGRDLTTNGQASVFSNDPPDGPESNPHQKIWYFNNSINHPQTFGAIRAQNDHNTDQPVDSVNIYNNNFCIPGAGSLSPYIITGSIHTAQSNNILSCPVILPVCINTLQGVYNKKYIVAWNVSCQNVKKLIIERSTDAKSWVTQTTTSNLIGSTSFSNSARKLYVRDKLFFLTGSTSYSDTVLISSTPVKTTVLNFMGNAVSDNIDNVPNGVYILEQNNNYIKVIKQ